MQIMYSFIVALAFCSTVYSFERVKVDAGDCATLNFGYFGPTRGVSYRLTRNGRPFYADDKRVFNQLSQLYFTNTRQSDSGVYCLLVTGKGIRYYRSFILSVVAKTSQDIQGNVLRCPCSSNRTLDPGRTADVEAVEAQAMRLETAWGVGDVDTIASLYTDDCRVFIPGGPQLRGPDALRTTARVAMTEGGFATIKLKTLEIFRMGEFYYRSGVNTVFDRNGDVLDIINFITIFRKDCGVWRYMVDIVNSQIPPGS